MKLKRFCEDNLIKYTDPNYDPRKEFDSMPVFFRILASIWSLICIAILPVKVTIEYPIEAVLTLVIFPKENWKKAFQFDVQFISEKIQTCFLMNLDWALWAKSKRIQDKIRDSSSYVLEIYNHMEEIVKSLQT